MKRHELDSTVNKINCNAQNGHTTKGENNNLVSKRYSSLKTSYGIIDRTVEI